MNKQLEIFKNNVNIGGYLADELDLVLEPALQKVVDDSANPFDDLLMATIYPTLSAELKKLINEKLDELFKDE